jgi:hypothetical protein
MRPGQSRIAGVASCRPVELSRRFDGFGITSAADPAAGAFDVSGSSFPAEDLPRGPALVEVDGVVFRFPDAELGQPDNLRCRGQRLELPVGLYDWIYVLAASERRSEDPLVLEHAAGCTSRQWLRVSGFWPESGARFGELLAFRCRALHARGGVRRTMAPTIWRARVGVPLRRPLRALRLPENPAVHLFALTLVSEHAHAA